MAVAAFLKMVNKYKEDNDIYKVMINIMRQKPDYQKLKVQENTENIIGTDAGKVFFKTLLNKDNIAEKIMKYNNVLLAIDSAFSPEDFELINNILKDNITNLDPSLIDMILEEGEKYTGRLNDLCECENLNDVLEAWAEANDDSSNTDEEEEEEKPTNKTPAIAIAIAPTVPAIAKKEAPAIAKKEAPEIAIVPAPEIAIVPTVPEIAIVPAPAIAIAPTVPARKITFTIKKPAAEVLVNKFDIRTKISIDKDGEILLRLYDKEFLAKTIDKSKIMMIDIESCMDMIYPFIFRVHSTSTYENVLRFIADGIKAINKEDYNCVNKLSYTVTTYEDNPRYCYILLK